MYSITVLILFFTFTNVFGNICPNVKPVENFDFIAYGQGTWYELARYHNEFETGDCVTMNGTQRGNGFVIDVSEVINRRRVVHSGILIQPSHAHNVGIVDYIFKDYQVQKKNVLAVNYAKYSVEYNCEYDAVKGTIKETGWIMSRTKETTRDLIKELQGALMSALVVYPDKLFGNNFSKESCAYDEEDIDRELPESLLQQIPRTK